MSQDALSQNVVEPSNKRLSTLIESVYSNAVADSDLAQTPNADRTARHLWLLCALTIASITIALLALSWSTVYIPVDQVFRVLFGGEAERQSWTTIVRDIRLPRVATSALVGIGLGLAGLQLQTLFRNPLASPFTLGVSAGASLGVALIVIAVPSGLAYGIGASGVLGHLGTVAGAGIGAMAVLMLMMAVAARVREMTTVLLLGVVIGALVSAVVTVLVYFADAQRTRQFIEWGFGSFHRVRRADLLYLTLAVFGGALITASIAKQLNVLLLGENYAQSLGLNVRRTRLWILISASLLAGTVTAYAGPISFLGIAVPHLARGLFGTSDHRILVPGTLLIGEILAIGCGILAEMPGSSLTLPINAATALFGAPIAVWVLLRARQSAWM
jgi:iron complex transport system permease protein